MLVIDQTAIINFTLKPAALSETVTVTGESPIVDVTRSDVSTAVSTQQIQDLPVASRRWIDLAMLTPGTSQDNIRGLFYRGNVNVGAGAREYSNGFVVDGVNNTWAEMGEPRQNFAMDAIQEFKVSTSTYKAEYGLATGGLLTVVTKSGTNQLHGSGLHVLPRRVDHREGVLPEPTQAADYRRYQYGGTIGGPIVKDKTHFFFAYEGTQGEPVLHGQRRGLWPQYEGTFQSEQTRWTYNAKLDHQLDGEPERCSSAAARRTSTGRSSPPAAARTPSASFDFARAAQVGGARPHLGDRTRARSTTSGSSTPTRSTKWRRPTATATGSPATSTARLPLLHAGLQLSVDQRRRLRQRQMGPESRWQIKDDFSYLMHDWGGTHQWKVGRRLQLHPVRGRQHGLAARQLDVPEGRAVQRRTIRPRSRRSTRTRCRPTPNIPTKTFAGYLQDDWQVGAAADVQPRAALRPAEGLVQRGRAGAARAASRTSSDATASFPLDVSVVQQPQTGRGDSQQLRAARRRGVGSGRTTA